MYLHELMQDMFTHVLHRITSDVPADPGTAEIL
jgi:hypothetical protein